MIGVYINQLMAKPPVEIKPWPQPGKSTVQEKQISWTNEENQKLFDAIHAGKTFPELFALFPYRSKSSVRGRTQKIKKNGLPAQRKQPWSAKDDDELLALREEGLSYRQIASVMSRSHTAIKKRLQFLGGTA